MASLAIGIVSGGRSCGRGVCGRALACVGEMTGTTTSERISRQERASQPLEGQSGVGTARRRRRAQVDAHVVRLNIGNDCVCDVLLSTHETTVDHCCANQTTTSTGASLWTATAGASVSCSPSSKVSSILADRGPRRFALLRMVLDVPYSDAPTIVNHTRNCYINDDDANAVAPSELQRRRQLRRNRVARPSRHPPPCTVNISYRDHRTDNIQHFDYDDANVNVSTHDGHDNDQMPHGTNVSASRSVKSPSRSFATTSPCSSSSSSSGHLALRSGREL